MLITKEREKNRLNVLENGYNITPHLDMNAQLFTEPLTMVLKSVGNRVSEIRQDGKKRFLKKIGILPAMQHGLYQENLFLSDMFI